jgi:hypothetical protein
VCYYVIRPSVQVAARMRPGSVWLRRPRDVDLSGMPCCDDTIRDDLHLDLCPCCVPRLTYIFSRQGDRLLVRIEDVWQIGTLRSAVGVHRDTLVTGKLTVRPFELTRPG